MTTGSPLTGTLYLVPTPIGNLEDITLRALRVLRECALIAAEDTRTTRVLLQHYDIHTPATSYHDHSRLTKRDAILDALRAGDVALVSDAGTPGISDPGYDLIRAVLDAGGTVVPLPGASAVITALVASGLPSDGFVYLGFLPRTDATRAVLFAGLRAERRTLIAYESPNRLTDTLRVLVAAWGGERPVCVARELTKLYEEFRRGSAAEVLAHYEATPPRGEIVLVIGGAGDTAPATWDEDAVRAALAGRLRGGMSLRDAAPLIASEAGWDRGQVYELGLVVKREIAPRR